MDILTAAYYAFWISLGLLFGCLLFLTALMLWFILKQRSRRAIWPLLIIFTIDIILVIAFFIWPFQNLPDLETISTDYLFFGAVVAAILALSVEYNSFRGKLAVDPEYQQAAI